MTLPQQSDRPGDPMIAAARAAQGAPIVLDPQAPEDAAACDAAARRRLAATYGEKFAADAPLEALGTLTGNMKADARLADYAQRGFVVWPGYGEAFCLAPDPLPLSMLGINPDHALWLVLEDAIARGFAPGTVADVRAAAWSCWRKEWTEETPSVSRATADARLGAAALFLAALVDGDATDERAALVVVLGLALVTPEIVHELRHELRARAAGTTLVALAARATAAAVLPEAERAEVIAALGSALLKPGPPPSKSMQKRKLAPSFPREPSSGTRDAAMLQALRDARGAFVSEPALATVLVSAGFEPGEDRSGVRAVIKKLRDELGWPIETAKKDSADQGWRLPAAC